MAKPRKIDAAWNTRIVTNLLMSSCGDLILDNRGDLCTRKTFDDNYKDVPWNEQKPQTKLATIGYVGDSKGTGTWTLTPMGAEYILENCSYDAGDRAGLEAIRKG